MMKNPTTIKTEPQTEPQTVQPTNGCPAGMKYMNIYTQLLYNIVYLVYSFVRHVLQYLSKVHCNNRSMLPMDAYTCWK